ncbi:MAG: pantetheine-phosphate adenylyltransferase [Clostridia bacterium]|nr:pantetheine-phosphate adenylyltransferase [Clostridia bacterium]
MSKRIAVTAGTYDPVTLGHVDIITRASALFDEVVVGIFENPDKVKLFSLDIRFRALQKAVEHLPNVRVVIGEGFVADFANSIGACTLIKGARNAKDFVYEKFQADYNKLHFGAETLLLISDTKFDAVSSTVVRAKLAAGEDVRGFLPAGVAEILKEDAL